MTLVRNRDIVLVDDGMATGSTATAAVQLLRNQLRVRSICLAIPVCSKQSALALSHWVDRLVYLKCSERFHAVGDYYEDFTQLDDAEVRALLDQGYDLPTSHQAA
jgi:putative phosphoribosyl transferase